MGRLENAEDFAKLAGLPLSAKYGNVKAIKIVYDLKTRQIHYINSNDFTYHHEFCTQKLGYLADIPSFNKMNYSNGKRKRFLLANINYYHALNRFALEILPVDLMTEKDLLRLRMAVVKTSFIGNQLAILLNSVRLQKSLDLLKEKAPVLSPFEIYKNLDYQAVILSKNCGILRFITDLDIEKYHLKPSDIIVINETPLVLPQVAGIITTEFQTPLSHLSILGQNR